MFVLDYHQVVMQQQVIVQDVQEIQQEIIVINVNLVLRVSQLTLVAFVISFIPPFLSLSLFIPLFFPLIP